MLQHQEVRRYFEVRIHRMYSKYLWSKCRSFCTHRTMQDMVFFTRGGYFTWRNHIILPFYGVRFIFAACLHHRSSFKPDCSNFFFLNKKKAKRLIKRFFTKNRYAPDYTRYVNRVIDSDISLKAYSNKLHIRSNF